MGIPFLCMRLSGVRETGRRRRHVTPLRASHVLHVRHGRRRGDRSEELLRLVPRRGSGRDARGAGGVGFPGPQTGGGGGPSVAALQAAVCREGVRQEPMLPFEEEAGPMDRDIPLGVEDAL